MFWRFGGYANISTIDTLLDKPDVTLEELLDESDLIQELKSHNTKLIEFLREDAALERLLEYVVAPKLEPVLSEEYEEEQEKAEDSKGKDIDTAQSASSSRLGSGEESDEKEKKRNRYAYVAAEILSSDSWSLSAALLENQPLLRKFWGFLKLPVPLDPLQASYFTKVNEALLDKKTEEMLDLFRSLDNVVKNMLQHVDSPMVMDLLLKIISLEKAEGGQGIVDWLHSQDLMPILLSFLSAEHSWATQTSAGDFLKAIITISANASQNEQSCIGPNELTRQLVSEACVGKLIKDMLKGGNPLTVGVGIVIEVIRKNNSDYDPDVGAEANTSPSSRDPIYLGTLLRMFATHVPDFMALILSPNHTIGGGDGPVTIRRKELSAAFGDKIEPLGFDRFKTCELMAELLHCSNMGLLNELGSEDFVKARDQERERLKGEGKLKVSAQDNRDLTSEDLNMKSSNMSRLESSSPDEMRRLEVQNPSETDGFEEVTHSGVLGDEAKDDFDEKSDMVDDFLTPTKQDTSISFLDKDDEDFVDEPLSSPRLKPDSGSFKRAESPDNSMKVMPLSPTKELSHKVGGLSFDEDTTMASPPSDAISTLAENGSQSSIVRDKNSLDALEELVQSHPQSSTGMTQDPAAPSLQIPLGTEPLEGGLSPHPEDKPAPLFAKKSEISAENIKALNDSNHVSEVASDCSTNTTIETDDTAMLDAADGSNSVLMGNTEEQSKLSLSPAPVVGDFLKMQFVEHKVVPTILDFFFRFPWNNFLHNVVYDVVQQVFNGPMDRGYNRTLAVDLFETGEITMRIFHGQRKSDEAKENNRMRLGYMGHLTLIAEEVVKFTERHPPELLSDLVLEKVMSSQWIQYVEVTLAETRERDNAILGGVRPDMSVGPRQAVMNAVNAVTGFGGVGSSALADAGLNGSASLDGMDLTNGTSAATSFTLTGSLLSGFGSSSDEDDEEMDDDNDEDGLRNFTTGNTEFSRYITTPSTTTATSGSDLDPPLAPPPPPPPLVIPPSRARRQLAARLALHSKQNTEKATPSNGNEPDAERSEPQQNLNPFAADEDDDDDGREDFRLGDIEIAAEGRGILPPATPLTGQEATLNSLNHELEDENGKNNHVGISKSSNNTRASFPSMWPFGQSSRSSHDYEVSAAYREKERERETARVRMNLSSESSDATHEKASSGNDANGTIAQSSDDSASSDDSDDEFASSAGIAGAKGKDSKRPSTTEATRRTSLEDDDEDEVVHVGRATAGEDEELVEIQHTEMQGVESGHHTS